MKKRSFYMVLGVIYLAVLTSCAPVPPSTMSYFDGALTVKSQRGYNDELTLTFYDAGRYEFVFSITPGYGGRKERLPPNSVKIVERVPRVIIINQRIIPAALRVQVTKDGRTETHDF